MELLAQVPLIGGLLEWAVPFLVVLTVIVFVHEFGHYWVGRMCGIHAQVFSVGFGKPLLKRTDRRGTQWQLAMIPLGGYVRFVGDMDPASAGRADDESLTPEERRVAFHNARLLPRALTVAAGPVANFLLCIAIYAGIALSVGKEIDKPVIGSLGVGTSALGLEVGDTVQTIGGTEVDTFTKFLKTLGDADGSPLTVTVRRGEDVLDLVVENYQMPRVVTLQSGMPAADSGMRLGDVIAALDGQPIRNVSDLQRITLSKAEGESIRVTALRGDETVEMDFVPKMVEREHPFTKETMKLPTMGISLSSTVEILPTRGSLPIHEAAWFGVAQTWNIIAQTGKYIGRMLFDGADTSQLGGPVRIAKMSGDVAKQGTTSFIELIAVLSTSIGLINLFPIPILDGGHLMFYLVEALRGRPVGEAAMRYGTMIGLSLVLLLLVFATYNDLRWLY